MSSEVEPLIQSCPNCSALLDVSEQEPFSEVQCPSCGNKIRARTRFDHFELIELIASGGMGTVYRARDVNLNRIVALKLLRKEFSVDEEYIEKLENEAKITASVSHPHVVKVFSFGCDSGLYYIAMELVDKGSLDDLMTLQGRIAEIQVLEIGIQVAQGLRAAVQAGLIHRDVKPGNILFADAHTAKVVDFGLAMPLEQTQDVEEEIWGTPYYVAPEKLNHEPEDLRSDIYSLGGTLFHALAGRPPFEADNASLVALKHLKSQVVSLQAFAPDISSPTSYVINRTLAKDPDERYQSYDELIEHLEYARSKLLENSYNPNKPKARVVMEGQEQQTILGYVVMGVIAVVIIVGALLYVFKDSIMMRNLSPAERERMRLMQAAGTVEEGYANARSLIIDGEAQSAVPVLWHLERRPKVDEPLKSWILVQQGLAAYLSNLPTLAKESFAKLHGKPIFSSRSEDARMANFFPDVARLIGREGRISPDTISDYQTTEFEPLGLMAFGLKEWEAGRFESAATFFEAFMASSPKGTWEWINQYKGLVQRYLDDYAVIKDLPASIQAADTAEKKTALLYQLEEMRMQLQVSGRLVEQLATYERSLNSGLRQLAKEENASPEPGDKGAGSRPRTRLLSVAVLNDQALRMVRDFQFEQARKSLETAAVAPVAEEMRGMLLRRIHYLVEFKKQLIADLEANGYTGKLTLKNGRTVEGKVVKPTEFRIEVTGDSQSTSVLWSDLRPSSIAAMAAAQIKTRSGEASSETDIDRSWYLGAYEMMTGERASALPRLMRAAEAKRAYARDLVLFDSASR
ncbi:MAG TPA: protein kinase [Chthoniobacteraceae bacterium]|nr:protein kinase [Chthoniobacteraceae bacterium]